MIERKDGQAFCEDTALGAIVRRFGTPCYVYSRRVLLERARHFLDAAARYEARVFFAAKANANPRILSDLHRLGFGIDAVSGGELAAAIAAKAPKESRLLSGVGKTDAELELAITKGVRAVLVESPEEWAALAALASQRRKAVAVGLRLNPDVLAPTHRKIATGDRGAKFGLTAEEARALVGDSIAQKYLRLEGLSCHIGSQLTTLEPFATAVGWMLEQARIYGGTAPVRLKWIDMGGGLGIRYREENPPSVEDYLATVAKPVREAGFEPWLEPGRWIIGPAAVLVTRALATRPRGQRAFLVVDAGMTELVRPALYDAWHRIDCENEAPARRSVDVVGPLCETGDVLGEARPLPHLSRGDLLWVEMVGAYGRAMASQYNRRGFAPEVLVDGKKVIRIDAGPVRPAPRRSR